MSKRRRKCLNDEDQIDKKVAELLAHKADLEIARTQEEDKDIIKALRGMKLEKHEFQDVIDGLESGEIILVRRDDLLNEDDGSTDAPKSEILGADDAPEREAVYGGQTYE